MCVHSPDLHNVRLVFGSLSHVCLSLATLVIWPEKEEEEGPVMRGEAGD